MACKHRNLIDFFHRRYVHCFCCRITNRGSATVSYPSLKCQLLSGDTLTTLVHLGSYLLGASFVIGESRISGPEESFRSRKYLPVL
jgi:hypothetical protein